MAKIVVLIETDDTTDISFMEEECSTFSKKRFIIYGQLILINISMHGTLVYYTIQFKLKIFSSIRVLDASRLRKKKNCP